MPVSYIRVTSQINRGDVTILSQKSLSLATMAKFPVQHQAIISFNITSLSSEHPQTNFSEIWIKIQQFSFKKTTLNILSEK